MKIFDKFKINIDGQAKSTESKNMSLALFVGSCTTMTAKRGQAHRDAADT